MDKIVKKKNLMIKNITLIVIKGQTKAILCSKYNFTTSLYKND